jgi:hypothetical protein
MFVDRSIQAAAGLSDDTAYSGSGAPLSICILRTDFSVEGFQHPGKLATIYEISTVSRLLSPE